MLLAGGDGEGAGHLGARRVGGVVVEDEPDPGQVLGRVEPGEGDGALEVERLVGEAALDVPGQAGVPAQRQGTEQGELVAEGVGDAVDVEREQPVEALVGGADDLAEDVGAAVVGLPGHGGLLCDIPKVRTFSMPSARARTQTLPP